MKCSSALKQWYCHTIFKGTLNFQGFLVKKTNEKTKQSQSLWWINLGLMPGAHQVGPSLPSLQLDKTDQNHPLYKFFGTLSLSDSE